MAGPRTTIQPTHHANAQGEFIRNVRREGPKDGDEALELIARHSTRGVISHARGSRGGIDQLDQRGDRGVEAEAFDVLGNAMNRAMKQLLDLGIGRRCEQHLA